jgi:uncharacterized protein YuzE
VSLELSRIEEVFFPETHLAKNKALSSGMKFVYYTTAEVAYQVITDQRIWMRNTSTMNDYMEIDYGQKLVLNAYEAVSGANLKAAINYCHIGLAEEVWTLFVSWLPSFRADTFISCISEHDPSEDDLGRLSMWRAYGGSTGVALVLNAAVPFFQMGPNALGAFSSPVSYLNQIQFLELIDRVAENIRVNAVEIRNADRQLVKNILFTMYRVAVMCTKHPGFKEEREWRIFASPSMFPQHLLESGIAIIRGVPQPILKLPLVNRPEKGIMGLAISDLLAKVIIGPCQFPDVTRRAIFQGLENANVPDPGSRIVKSDIPLRN